MQHIGYWRRKENLEFCPSGFGKWQGLGFRVSGFEVGRVKVIKFVGWVLVGIDCFLAPVFRV